MTLLIGYGNDIRGYDRFGIELANMLSPYIDTITTHHLSLDIIPTLDKYDTIIFADVSYGTPHKAIACAISEHSSNISHKISIFDFISFASSYHNKPFEYVLYSILSTEFEYSTIVDVQEELCTISSYILSTL
jgi:Ni,Fe-hydrogenase maturation factor